MIKRMNKITSILVAAAAIVSIVPATGVSAADYKKIDSKEGTIYEAVAYKDGKFYVDGNTKDGDTDGAYFLNSGKYTELDNIDSGSNVTGTYGDKYLNVDSGDYYVDLSTGKVTDTDLASDNKDDAATALRKVIKADAKDRYTDYDALKTDLEALPGAKFSDTWYKTAYTTSAAATVSVYTDAKGNYIDADYNVGKIKVEKEDAATASLTNTKDTENGTTVAVSAVNVIGQDASNIYRTVKITVTSDKIITKIDGISVAGNAFAGAGTNTVTFDAIQKISKAQASGDIDGAKYAKTVNTYVISTDAGASATLLANAKFNIVDGKVIAYTDGTSVDAQTIELKSTQGYYYTDITEVDAEDATDVDVDANGNLWRLQGGYVYKFDNVDAWNKVYKVDGAMQKLSVYDQNNMVVWNEADEVYSIVGNKEESTTPEIPAVTTGWVQAADKTWTYNKADGTKATGWIKDGSTWYFLKADGVMSTGWVKDGSTWYFLKADGVMSTGWVKDGSTWYFLNGSGAMKTGWVNDNGTWYYLAGSGAMQTGWINDNGTWYYCNASGAMLANTTVDGYKLNASGAWVK
jgi:glucan-binding YG repeat protein